MELKTTLSLELLKFLEILKKLHCEFKSGRKSGKPFNYAYDTRCLSLTLAKESYVLSHLVLYVNVSVTVANVS